MAFTYFLLQDKTQKWLTVFLLILFVKTDEVWQKFKQGWLCNACNIDEPWKYFNEDKADEKNNSSNQPTKKTKNYVA